MTSPDKKENPYVRRTEEGALLITAAGEAFLAPLITDTAGSVYAFTGQAPQPLRPQSRPELLY